MNCPRDSPYRPANNSGTGGLLRGADRQRHVGCEAGDTHGADGTGGGRHVMTTSSPPHFLAGFGTPREVVGSLESAGHEPNAQRSQGFP